MWTLDFFDKASKAFQLEQEIADLKVKNKVLMSENLKPLVKYLH